MSNNDDAPRGRDPRGQDPGSWLDPDFAHGQGDYYGRYGVPAPDEGHGHAPDTGAAATRHPAEPASPGIPPGTQEPGRRRWWPWVAGGAAVVVAAGAVTFALTRPDDTSDAPAAGGESTSVAPSPSSSSSSSTAPTVPAVVPGWEASPAPLFDEAAPRAVVDLPPRSVTRPSQGGGTVPAFTRPGEPRMQGYIAPGETAMADAAASFMAGACAADRKADGGMVGWIRTTSDPVQAVDNLTEKWSQAMATSTTGKKVSFTPGSAKNSTVNQGRTPAAQSRTIVPQSDKNPCGDYPRELVLTSFDTSAGPVTLVLVRLTKGPLAMDDTTMNTVLSSARPMP